MLKLERLPHVSIETMMTAAKGNAGYQMIARMGFAKVEDRDVLWFDNSDDQYGTMYIDIEDLKRIIDREKKLQKGEEQPKMVGKLKFRYGLQGLLQVKPGHPVYEIDGKHFIDVGQIRVPFSGDEKPEIEFNK